MNSEPKISDIKDAHARIQKYIHKTPVATCESINKLSGCEIFFKCENLQKVGAFKARGATNTILSLTDNEAKNGVATHSSGNHAQAVSFAARLRNIPAYIVMPENAPKVKINAVKNYGGQITFCKPTLEARECAVANIIEKTKATLIHPYDDFRIISGQGTAALELIQEVKGLDIVMAPVGGGGLLSGTAICVKALSEKSLVFGAEPENVNDAYQSFKMGQHVKSPNNPTCADGLRTSLGLRNFSIILKKVDDILTVSEISIKEALRLTWERAKIFIEPSAAVPLAAVMSHPSHFKNKKVGIILSGGNADVELLAKEGVFT